MLVEEGSVWLLSVLVWRHNHHLLKSYLYQVCLSMMIGSIEATNPMFEVVDDEAVTNRENYPKVVLQRNINVKNAIVWVSAP